jgi:hypothetical protein
MIGTHDVTLQSYAIRLGVSGTELIANSCSRALLKIPIVAQLVKILPALYGMQNFITVFPRACQWTIL